MLNTKRIESHDEVISKFYLKIIKPEKNINAPKYEFPLFVIHPDISLYISIVIYV